MRPNQVTYTPADDDANGFGDDLQDSAAGVFTLTATTAGTAGNPVAVSD